MASTTEWFTLLGAGGLAGVITTFAKDLVTLRQKGKVDMNTAMNANMAANLETMRQLTKAAQDAAEAARAEAECSREEASKARARAEQAEDRARRCEVWPPWYVDLSTGWETYRKRDTPPEPPIPVRGPGTI